MRAYSFLPVAFACLALATACSKSSDSDASASPSPSVVASDVASAAATANATASAVASQAPSDAPSAALASPAPSAVAVSFTDLAGNINAPGIMRLGALGVLDSTTGTFGPDEPVKRRDFVRWLFKTNNAVFVDTPSKVMHPATTDESQTFTDVPSSDADFKYIQGMSDAGISVGFPDKTFKADSPITREQAIAIKAILDHGGISASYIGPKNAGYALYNLPQWKDRAAISVTYVGAIAEDVEDEGEGKVNNMGRTFGSFAAFNPQKHVTRGEAATMFGIIGGHAERMSYQNVMRSVEDTLHPKPSPTP